MTEDPAYADQLARVHRFYAERGAEADLAQHVLDEWSDTLGLPARDVVTVLRIADLNRFCAARGLDRPLGREDYDTTDDLTLLATAVGQHQAVGEVQPVLRMAGLAAVDRLEQIHAGDSASMAELAGIRGTLMVSEPG